MAAEPNAKSIAAQVLEIVPYPVAIVARDGALLNANRCFQARYASRSLLDFWRGDRSVVLTALESIAPGLEVEIQTSDSTFPRQIWRFRGEADEILAFLPDEDPSSTPRPDLPPDDRYRLLLQHSPLSLQVLSPDGWTLWVNDAFEQLWGLRLSDLKTFNVLEDPMLRDKGITGLLKRAFMGEVTDLPAQPFEIMRREGDQVTYEVREVRARAYPIFGHDRSVSEIVITHEDVTETAAAQKRSVSSQNRLQLVLEAVGAGVWVYHLGTDRLEWSPEQRQLLGVGEDVEPTMDRFESLIHPADRDMARRAFARTTHLGERLNIEFRMLLPHRRERWIASVGHVRRGIEGNIERVVGINFDVTERIIAAETLKRTQRSLALVMQGGRMGYWTRDLVHSDPSDRVEWSPELEEVFGLPSGSFEGTQWDFLRRVHPEDRDKLRATVNSAVQHHEDYSIEFRYIHASGAVRWMEGRGRATYDPSGRPTRIDGIGIDITPQKQAEEALRRSEERFRRLANAVPSFVWTASPDGAIDYVNEQWERYTGMSVSASLDGSWREARHPDDQEASAVAWQKSLETGQPYRFESRFRRSDGAYRWFLSNAEPLRNRQGEISGWFGTGTDIHDQKRTEAALRFLLALGEQMRQLEGPDEIIQTTERLLRRHLEASRCIYAEMESDGETIEVRFEDCDGCAPFIGSYPLRSFGDLVFNLLRDGETLMVADVATSPITAETLGTYEMYGIGAFVAVPLVKQNRLVAVLAIQQLTAREWTFEDVELIQTVADRCWAEIARARANQQLAMSELQYREIAETLPQIVWSIRPNGEHDYANVRWREFIGPAMAGRADQWSASIHPDDLDVATAAWDLAFLRGQPYESEHRMRRFDGEYRWFLVRAVPIRDHEGQLVRWFGTATDIHEQKEAEAELERRVRERTAELEAANRELEGFTYTVSHDLRAPLRAIAGASMMLMEDLGPLLREAQVRLLLRQADNAKRLGVLIDDLLHFSRMSRVELETVPADLSEMVRSVLIEVNEELGRPIEDVVIHPTQPAQVDAKLIRFVLLNLVGNAAKFSRESVRLEFGQAADGAFYLRDHGIGFDPRYAHKVFEPFERLVTESEFPGTGIGLANVKRIVERHGGEVWAESLPNEGATFYFRVPLA